MSFEILFKCLFFLVAILYIMFVIPDFVAGESANSSGDYSLRVDIDKDIANPEQLARDISSRFRYNDSKDTASYSIEGDSIIWVDIQNTDEYKMNIYQVIENSRLQFIVGKERTYEVADSVEKICLSKTNYINDYDRKGLLSRFRSFYSVRCNDSNSGNRKVFGHRFNTSKEEILEYLGDSLEYRLENTLINDPNDYSEYFTIALLYRNPIVPQGAFTDVTFESKPIYDNTYADLKISFKTELPESVIADIPFDENGETIFGIIVNEEVRINGTITYDGDKFHIEDEFSTDEVYFLENFFLCNSINQKFEYCYHEKEELFSSIKNSKTYRKYNYLKNAKK